MEQILLSTTTAIFYFAGRYQDADFDFIVRLFRQSTTIPRISLRLYSGDSVDVNFVIRMLAALADNKSVLELSLFLSDDYEPDMQRAIEENALNILKRNKVIEVMHLNVANIFDNGDSELLQEAFSQNQVLSEYNGLKRDTDIIKLRNLEASRVLEYARIIGHGKITQSTTLPAEVLRMIICECAASDDWDQEQLVTIIRCAYNRQTLGKLVDKNIKFSRNALYVMSRRAMSII